MNDISMNTEEARGKHSELGSYIRDLEEIKKALEFNCMEMGFQWIGKSFSEFTDLHKTQMLGFSKLIARLQDITSNLYSQILAYEEMDRVLARQKGIPADN